MSREFEKNERFGQFFLTRFRIFCAKVRTDTGMHSRHKVEKRSLFQTEAWNERKNR